MDGDRRTRGRHLSFLVRLWRVSVAGTPVWRVSLQRPGEAGQVAFGGLDVAMAFLRAETGEGSEGQTGQAPRGEPEPLFDKAPPALCNDSSSPFCPGR
jgi:hypothetical protein